MKYKVLAVKWRSALHTIGFVAYATENPENSGEWNSVVGYVPDHISLYEEDSDAQYIAANGAKIEWPIAEVLFPHLDITKHKYYTEE